MFSASSGSVTKYGNIARPWQIGLNRTLSRRPLLRIGTSVAQVMNRWQTEPSRRVFFAAIAPPPEITIDWLLDSNVSTQPVWKQRRPGLIAGAKASRRTTENVD
jgi:hypothetical protein